MYVKEWHTSYNLASVYVNGMERYSEDIYQPPYVAPAHAFLYLLPYVLSHTMFEFVPCIVFGHILNNVTKFLTVRRHYRRIYGTILHHIKHDNLYKGFMPIMKLYFSSRSEL